MNTPLTSMCATILLETRLELCQTLEYNIPNTVLLLSLGITHFARMGTISALNFPAFWAAPTFWKDRAAKASWVARMTL